MSIDMKPRSESEREIKEPSSLLGQRQKIGEDLGVVLDPDLSGYQDDLASGDSEDEVQHDQGDTPEDVTLMPEGELKEELGKLAVDEHGPNGGLEEEMNREHIEDVDEHDKR